MLEDQPAGELPLQGFLEPADHQQDQQRVAAEVEEAVVDADPLDAEGVAPDGGDPLLQLVARRHVGRLRAARRTVRRGEGAAVHLAAAVERQGGEDHEDRRHHVVRQAAAQQLLEIGGGRRRLDRGGGGGDQVGGEPAVPGAVLAGHHDRLFDGGVGGERRLDLPRLDAEAAHLHLRVAPAQELQRAVGEPAGEVAGVVEALAGAGGERMGDEDLGGEVRAAEVAAGHPQATRVEAAAHPHRHRPQVAVEDVDRGVVERPADGDRGPLDVGRGDRAAGGEGGVLGRPVAVDQPAPRHLGEDPPGLRQRHHVAPRHQLAQGAEAAEMAVDHQGEEAGAQPERGDAVAGDRLADLLQRQPGARQEGEAAAVEQRPPDLEGRDVEGDGGDLEEHLVRREIGEARLAHQADDPLVGDGDPLRPAGRAGGVHHIGHPIPALGEAREVARVLGLVVRVGRVRRVEGESGDAEAVEGAEQLRAGEDDRGAGLRQHERQPLARVGGDQRQVGATGLEGGQVAEDQLGRGVEEDADRDLGADAEAAQAAGEAVGPAVQLAVGDAVVAAGERHGSGVGGGRRLEEAVDEGAVGARPPTVAPVHHQLVALRRREQRQLGRRPLRRRRQAGEEGGEVAQQALGRGAVEEVAAVLQGGEEAGAVGDQREAELELRRAGVQGEGRQLQARPLERRHRRVLEGEEDLEEGGELLAAVGAQLLDQLLERHVAVSEGGEGGLPCLRQQLAAAGVGVEPRAQDEGVDEEADQPLDLGAVAVRHRHADGEVALPRVARQQQLPGGEERHEGGHPRGPAEAGQSGGGAGLQRGRGQASREGGYRAPRPVGGHVELRHPFQRPAPEAELALQPLALEPAPLPEGEVGVLDRQLGQRRRAPGEERGVEGRQLAQQHAGRPAVRDDVVEVGQQHVLAVAPHPQQQRADQGVPVEGEGARRLSARDAQRLLAGAHVHQRQLQLHERRHGLHRLAVVPGEAGPQRLVAADDLAQARAQRGDVERPVEAGGERDVVGREPRLELVEDPQPLLGEGEGDRAVAGGGEQRGERGAGVGPQQRLDAAGEVEDGGLLEDGGQRQIDAEGLPHPRHHLGRHQGVAAEAEERLAEVDPLAAEERRHGPCQQLLRRRLRRGIAPHLREGGRLGEGEARAVDLAAGVERQRRHLDEGRRHHRLGEAGEQRRAQIFRWSFGLADPPGDEPAAAARFGEGGDQGVAGRRERPQGGLDLAGLDAEAADLHLVIAAAEELEGAVEAPADQVAGAVEAPSGRGGVGHEALGGEVRPAEVAAGEAVAAEAELAGGAGRRQPSPEVEDQGAGAGDRSADRHRAAAGLAHPLPGREGRRLRGSIDVQQAPRRAGGEHSPHRGRVHGLAAEQQVAQSGEGVRRLLGHGVEQGRGEEHRGDAALGQPRREVGGMERLVAADDGEAGAGQQRRPDLEGGGVEGRGRHLRHHVVRGQAHIVGVEQQVEDGAVAHHHSLGGAGGARGVDDIGQGVRGNLRERPRQLLAVLLQDLAGEEDRGPGVLQQGLSALLRMGGIERQVGGTGLEDGEHAHDHPGRALGLQPHDRSRTGTHPAQSMGEAGGAAVQLAIGEDRAVVLDGHGVRRGGGAAGEQAVDREAVRPAVAAGAAARQGLPDLGLGQVRQPGERPARVLGQPGQQGLQAREQAGGRGAVEQGAVVLELELQGLLGGGDQAQGVVGPGVVAHVLDRELVVPPGALGRGVVLEHHQGLEEGGAARHLAPSLHLEEGGVLVAALRRQLLLEAAEPLPGRFGGAQAGAHGEGVDEGPHHRLGAGKGGGAAGDHVAVDHVLLAGEAGEEERPGPLHQGVERDPLPPRPLLKGPGRLHGELQGGVLLLAGRPRPGRQTQAGGGGEPRQGTPPEGLGVLEVPRALPHQPGHVVAEGAHGRQLGRPPLARQQVGGEEVAHHMGAGPAVEQEVVVGPHQAPGPLVEVEEGEAHQGGAGDVEAAAQVLLPQGLEPRLLLAGGHAAPVLLPPGEAYGAADHLHGPFEPLPEEGGAQG